MFVRLFTFACFAILLCVLSDSSLAQRQKKSLVPGPAAGVVPTVTPRTTGTEVVKPRTTGTQVVAPRTVAPEVVTPRTVTPEVVTPVKKKVDIFDKPVGKPAPTATKGAPSAGGSKKRSPTGESEVPEPETVVVVSKQPGTAGVNLSCMLFVSSESAGEESKSVSPMLLIHDWGGSMTDLAPLAAHLQGAGHTVLVPDLRGHGSSTSLVNSSQVIDYSEFSNPEVASIENDLEACKKFLMQYNNDGKLNINMLSVLAVGDMCPVVSAWVLRDWSYPDLGRIKQGKDVQSLFLISPTKKFKQYSMAKIAKHPLMSGKQPFHIPTLMIWGEASSTAKESNAIYKAMAKARPESTATSPAQRWAEQDLFRLELPMDGKGAELLSPNPAIYNFIATFNQQKIMSAPERFPWQSRAKTKTK